jgi:PPP family 3-phenylpropionic acid transporter
MAGFYFFYFCAVGVFTPFMGLYLVERGCTPAQVGVVFGILGAMRIATPYLWGTIGDRTNRRVYLIKAALLAALLSFAAIWLVPDYGGMLALLVAYGFFINGTLSQFEVVVFQHLADRRAEYARIRLWASIGFVVAVILLGPVFDKLSLSAFPLWVGALYFIAWAGASRIPEPPVQAHHHSHGSLLSVLRKPPVIALMAIGFLMQLSSAPFNAFFSIYLDEHGYAKSTTGTVWAIAVAAEIVVFRYVPQMQNRFGLRNLMLFSLLALAVRWILQTFVVDDRFLLMAVNCLSAVSVGLNYIASLALVNEMFPPTSQGRGTALYIGISNGVGTALGSLITGFLWTVWHADWIWYAASLVAFVALFVAWRWLHPEPARWRVPPPAPQPAAEIA